MTKTMATTLALVSASVAYFSYLAIRLLQNGYQLVIVTPSEFIGGF